MDAGWNQKGTEGERLPQIGRTRYACRHKSGTVMFLARSPSIPYPRTPNPHPPSTPLHRIDQHHAMRHLPAPGTPHTPDHLHDRRAGVLGRQPRNGIGPTDRASRRPTLDLQIRIRPARDRCRANAAEELARADVVGHAWERRVNPVDESSRGLGRLRLGKWAKKTPPEAGLSDTMEGLRSPADAASSNAGLNCRCDRRRTEDRHTGSV